MRNLLGPVLACLALVGVMAPDALAQSGEPFPGIDRAVARVYMFPSTEMLTVTTDDGSGTPVSETVVLATPDAAATPDPSTVSAVVFMSIAIFAFDSDAHAQDGYAAMAQSMEAARVADPRFANAVAVPLDGVGDQSSSVEVRHVNNGIPLTLIDSVVRDGRFVYAIQGTLVRLDGQAELARMMGALVGTDAGEGAGTFDPAGASNGGLWRKLAEVNPVLADGSDVFDTVLYPVPAGTPAA